MKHVLTDDNLTHLDKMSPNRDKRFAELTVFLDITFERNLGYLCDLLPKLLKEGLTAKIERLQFLLSMLELTH